ncbi:DNA-3-methyladenine glycosylase [soil metagenome]
MITTSLANLPYSVDQLVAREPRFAAVVERHGLPALRLAEPGLPALLRIVTEQVLSLKAAATIWARLERELHPLDPPAILRRRHTTLMKLGLSGAKARSFRALAKSVGAGEFSFETLQGMADDDALAALVALPGVGPWTAHIYCLTCLGRADIWPSGDLALRAAAADLLKHDGDLKSFIALADNWRPWRSVAARLLWSHYRGMRGMPQPQT